EVHDVHQAEDERQARGHEEDEQPHGDAGDSERHPGRRAADEKQRAQQHYEHEERRLPVNAIHWCASSDKPSNRVCNASSAARSAILPVCTIRPESITATESPSDLAAWKFCSTIRIVVSDFLSSANAAIRFWMIAGARPLVGSSISTSFLGSAIAREIASI